MVKHDVCFNVLMIARSRQTGKEAGERPLPKANNESQVHTDCTKKVI